MPAKKSEEGTTKDFCQTKSFKSVKENAEKITWKEIQKGFKGIEKAQKGAWTAINETKQAARKTRKKNDFIELRKLQDKTWGSMKEKQENIGGLNNLLGSMVELLLIPDLPKKFKRFGYNFTRLTDYSYEAGVYAQIDGMLENTIQAVAIEVKTKLTQSDVDDHLIRMEKIRKHADENGDKRQFMGAMAAFIVIDSAKKYALKKGLFVIEPNGEDVKVTGPETAPRVW